MTLHGIDINTPSDLLGAHEEDVQHACAGYGGEGDEAGQQRPCGRAEAFEPRHEGVET